MYAHIDQLGWQVVKFLLNGELRPEVNTQDYMYSTALIAAIKKPSKHKAQFVDALLEAGADPNLSAPDGATPLMVACMATGSGETIKNIIRALLKAGGDVSILDNYGNTALMWYASHGTDTEIAKILIEAGTDVNTSGIGGSALAICCSYGMVEFEGKLIKKEMFKRYVTERKLECTEPESKGIDTDLLNLLISAGANVNCRYCSSPLKTYCFKFRERPDTFDASPVQILIDAKANVNATYKSETALHEVVRSKRKDKLQIIQSLLDAGAAQSLRDTDVISPLGIVIKTAGTDSLDLNLIKVLAKAEDVANDHIKCRIDKSRKLLLIKTIKTKLVNKLDVVRELLDANINVNVVDRSNRNALMIVIQECGSDPDGTTSLPMIQLLVERGASVNAVVPNDTSPLILAIKNYRIDYIHQVLKLLLDAGADPNYMDKDKHTALYYAMRVIVIDTAYIEYIRYLLEAGAHIYFGVDDIGQVNCLQMYLAGYPIISLPSDRPKLDRICKVYELFKVYHRRLKINRWEISSAIMKRITDIDKQFDRWQNIMSTSVQPLIPVEAGRIILKPDSHRVKLMACKYVETGIEHLDQSLRSYYSIHDDASFQARLNELDTV